ncbi:BatD family protein [Desulfocastanea catecholica]
MRQQRRHMQHLFTINGICAFARLFFCAPAILTLCLSILGPGTLSASAAEVSVEASLSHQSFPLDKAARLTITVTGTSHNADIALPEIDGIRLHNRGSSSRISVVNGAVSSSISHNYLVQAEKPGEYTIPPITVTAGGDSFFTESLQFLVTPTGQQPPGNADQAEPTTDEIAFLRISQESGSHYSGEIVPLTIKAYFTQAYRADINSLPTLNGDGVVMSPLPDKPQQTEESLNGRMYHVLTWDTSLTGIKTGEHAIRFSLEATLLIPQKRRNLSPFGGNSLFDDAFFNDPALDSFFGSQQRKPIVSVSPEIVFHVLPLPSENQPDTFTGAVGEFDFDVTAKPVEVEVGEPITLTMEIVGTGNFDRVEAPVFPENGDWKTYSPTANFAKTGDGSAGSKVFEQAVVAKSGAVTSIPPLSFSYFDPREKRYITKSSKAVAISLRQSAVPTIGQPLQAPALGQPPQPPASQPGPVPALSGLAPIHLEIGSSSHRIAPLVTSSWLLSVAALCVLTLGVLLVLKLRQKNIDNHPEKELHRQKKLLLDNDLKKVEQAQAAGDGKAFLTHGRTAIQNQLGLLWHIEPAALSLADISKRLPADAPLIAIFRAAEEAAYAGATLSDEKMHDYFLTLKMELEKLL